MGFVQVFMSLCYSLSIGISVVEEEEQLCFIYQRGVLLVIECTQKGVELIPPSFIHVKLLAPSELDCLEDYDLILSYASCTVFYEIFISVWKWTVLVGFPKSKYQTK